MTVTIPEGEPDEIPFVALDIEPEATWDEIVGMLGLDQEQPQ